MSNPLHSSESNEWYTPEDVLALARHNLGVERFALDPASCAVAQQRVDAERYFTKEDNGLGHRWEAESIWLNPPYGRQGGKWVNKLVEEFLQGRARSAALLVNNTPDRQWFQYAASVACGFFFFGRRIKFIDEWGERQGSPTHGDTLFLFNPNYPRFDPLGFSGIWTGGGYSVFGDEGEVYR